MPLVSFLLLPLAKKKNTAPHPTTPMACPMPPQKAKIFLHAGLMDKIGFRKQGFIIWGGGENDTIRIFGSPNTSGYFEDITIVIKGNLLEGVTYNFNGADYYADYSTNKTCLGYTGSGVTHCLATSGYTILTKFDASNKILSGKFECVIPIPSCNTLNITDGRFDIKYY